MIWTIPPQRVVHKFRRIGDDGGDFVAQPRFVAAAQDESGDKVRCAPRGFAEGHAEMNKILCVHDWFNKVEASLIIFFVKTLPAATVRPSIGKFSDSSPPCFFATH